MSKIKTALKVTRAPFSLSLVGSVLVGTAIAWREGFFEWGLFLLTLLGIVFINFGQNMSNDYFDHLSGTDEINRELTPFSGGSRTIQDGILSARQVLIWSIFFFLIGILIGLYLAVVRGWLLLWLGIAGVSIAFFLNAPPLKFASAGLGELATAIGSGPLIVVGSYYVQAQQATYEALWASIPVGLLGAAILWINQFPDYEADREVGKKTLVVRLGRKRAVWGYVALLVAAYLVIVVTVVLSILPYTALVALATVPLAYKAVRGAVRFHSETPKLIPTQATHIQLYLANALFLSLGYVVARFV